MSTTLWRPTRGARALARRDASFGRLLDRIGPIAIPQRPSTFETLARAIVYQQLTGRAAGTIWSRLVGRLDGRLTAEEVLRRRRSTLRAAGLSAAKTESLRDLARHVEEGRVDPGALVALPDDEVLAALTQVRGIGPWSAQMHLIFSLGRADVWPTLDLGVRKGLALFLGLPELPSAREAEAMGEPYRPWRTLLAWSMWRIHDVAPW